MKMNFQRNLIGMEDIAFGLGNAAQVRGTTPVNITRVNAAIIPYDANFTLKEKIDSLDTTHYVDEDNLPVYIATPKSNTNLNLLDVIWVKTINSTRNEVYYYDKMMFAYDPTNNDLILDPAVFQSSVDALTAAYIAADIVVANGAIAAVNAEAVSRQAADSAIISAYQAADTALVANLGLGSAAQRNVGTAPNNVVALDASSKLPAVDGSQLTNLPSATAAAGWAIQHKLKVANTVATFNTLIARAGVVPSPTAGTELMSETITPANSGNKITAKFNGSAHRSAAGVGAAVLLYVNGVFVKGDWTRSSNNTSDEPSALSISYEHTAVNTDPVVFSIRTGPVITAGDIRFNDNSWGANGKGATLELTEVKG